MDSAPPELALLVEALDLDAGPVPTLISREPLGAGSVAGFDVAGVGGPLTYFVDTSRRTVAVETGILSGTPSDPEVRVWLHPADPHLPALAPVAFAHAVQGLLSRLDIDVTGDPQLVVYRAGRRAVLRVPTADGATWVKAVPPDRVAPIVDAHRALEAAGIPVPVVRGWSEQGLMVWDAANGVPVSDAPWTPERLLDAVDDLRARLAGVVLDRPASSRLAHRLDWYSDRLVAVLPAASAAMAAAVVERCRASWDDPGAATIHGDLHFGQLFVDDDLNLSGVIDVDTAGLGAPSDDSSAFIAHAIASATLTPPPNDARVWALARLAIERWNGPGVRARTATHLLGHALGAGESGDVERADRLVRAAASVSIGDVHALGGA